VENDGANKVKASMKLLVAAFALMIVPATVKAKNCFIVNGENSPSATLSGRITTQHKVPKNTEGIRAAGGYYLRLDTPLPVQWEVGERCWDFVDIAIHIKNDDEDAKVARLNGRHVVVGGQLGRFGSAKAVEGRSIFLPLAAADALIRQLGNDLVAHPNSIGSQL
jgi:hypothetical protein